MGDGRRATGDGAHADLQHIFYILRVHQHGPEVLEPSGRRGMKSTSWYSNLFRRGAEKEDGARGWTRWVMKKVVDEDCGRGLRERLAEDT